MIYSGLDWSGRPGRERHDPLLVLAMVHLDEREVPILHQELLAARARINVTPDYVFRHVGASAATHAAFCAALQRVRLQGHVLMIDKSVWTEQYMKQRNGDDRICDGIVTLVMGCGDEVVAGQRLFIDLRRQDMRQVRNVRTAIRQALNGVQRRSFGNVQPCPDHRIHGAIVQVADMIAGEVREQGGVTGPYLPIVAHRIPAV